MRKRLTFHVFAQYGGPGANNGLWRHPELEAARDPVAPETWLELVRIAERGRLDSLFFADAVGFGGFTPGDTEAETRAGRLTIYDPTLIIPVLAAATEHLGFMFTSSILQDPPFTFARRASTLDYLTGGRVGWNIVTSYSPNAARNFGLDDLPSREQRYAWADEYAHVAYKLWEGSWEDGAVLKDGSSGVYIDPSKVHEINHVGQRYRVKGPHMVDPSPQRSPMLMQAGGSGPGMAFAAQHAEIQFVPAGTPETMAQAITAVRELAARAGRGPDDIAFVVPLQFVIGSTVAEAQRKVDEIDAFTDWDEVAGNLVTSLGVDLRGLDPDLPVRELKSTVQEGGMSASLNSLISALPKNGPATVRDVLNARLNNRRIVGTPQQIADELERWQDAGLGGVVIAGPLRLTTNAEFVDYVIPVLQDRGLAQREYTPGTIRNKIMGYGDHLPESHPAAKYRR